MSKRAKKVRFIARGSFQVQIVTSFNHRYIYNWILRVRNKRNTIKQSNKSSPNLRESYINYQPQLYKPALYLRSGTKRQNLWFSPQWHVLTILKLILDTGQLHAMSLMKVEVIYTIIKKTDLKISLNFTSHTCFSCIIY